MFVALGQSARNLSSKIFASVQNWFALEYAWASALYQKKNHHGDPDVSRIARFTNLSIHSSSSTTHNHQNG